MQAIYSIVGVIIGGLVVYLFLSRKKDANESSHTGFQLLLQQLNDLQRTVDQKLGDSEKSFKESLQFQSSQSAQIISDITERLIRLDEGNKQVLKETLRAMMTCQKPDVMSKFIGWFTAL